VWNRGGKNPLYFRSYRWLTFKYVRNIYRKIYERSVPETCLCFKLLRGNILLTYAESCAYGELQMGVCTCARLCEYCDGWHIYLQNTCKHMQSVSAAKWKITNCTEATETSPKDHFCIPIRLLRFHLHCTFSLFPSRCLSVLFIRTFIAIISTKERLFEMVGTGQRGLAGKTVKGTEDKTSSDIVSTRAICGTSSPVLSVTN
jgi:hypothetical protein